MSRVTIGRDSVQFYYGYALVDSLAEQASVYTLSATLYHREGVVEVVPSPTQYTLEAAPSPGAIRFGGPGYGGKVDELVKCPE